MSAFHTFCCPRAGSSTSQFCLALFVRGLAEPKASCTSTRTWNVNSSRRFPLIQDCKREICSQRPQLIRLLLSSTDSNSMAGQAMHDHGRIRSHPSQCHSHKPFRQYSLTNDPPLTSSSNATNSPTSPSHSREFLRNIASIGLQRSVEAQKRRMSSGGVTNERPAPFLKRPIESPFQRT